VPEIENLYKAYKDKIQFFLVYIREAHPLRRKSTSQRDDHKRPSTGKRRGINIPQHKNIEERVVAATRCIQGLKLSLPTLIDDMKRTYEGKYGGFRAGTAIVDIDGKIVFSSQGARGCQPKKAEKLLKVLLANGGKLATSGGKE